MELKSFIPYKEFPDNKQCVYEVSAMGGSADLLLTFSEDREGRKFFHLKCVAGVKLLNIQYHFECVSRWEDINSKLTFDSYEEKDFTKDIHKKWEMNAEGMSYLEDKKGLVLERDVVYFSDKEIHNIFDPLSAVVQFSLNPLEQEQKREIHIFGKQRILEVVAQRENNSIVIHPVKGMNDTWTKLLSELKLNTKDNFIESAEIPSPLKFGTLKLNLKEIRSITRNEAQNLLEGFSKS